MRGAMAFWIAVSVVSWVVLATLLFGFSSDDPEMLAEQPPESVQIAPAAGPKAEDASVQ